MLSRTVFSSHRLQAFVLSLLATLLLANVAQAQDTVTGAFEGTVNDRTTGAPIAGASVQFINQLSEVPVAKRTDAQGRFYQGLLPPGTYTIRVVAQGYQSREVEQRLLATRPNAVVPVPVLLDPESTTATATPTPTPTGTPTATGTPMPQPAAAPDRSVVADINMTDARRDGAFTEEEVSTLALGVTTVIRTFDELALLLPGVAEAPQTEGGGAGPGVGSGVGSAGQFSVNGLRSRANNFMVDGSDNNDEDIGVRRQGFLSLVPQPVESIKEFQTITLLAPAQFGRNIGGQVNAISKSGGNGTHGTFFGFLNSSQLNARNPFDTANGNATTAVTSGGRAVLDCTFIAMFPCTTANGRPVTVSNQSGGQDSSTLTQGGLVLGGPLMPDKLFYFISAEGQFLNARKEASFAVPTVAQRGLFGTGATGIAFNPFDPTMAVSAFPTSIDADSIFSLFPLPNNPTGVYGPNTFTQNLPASGQGKVFSGKVDWNFNVHERQQQFTARYNFTDDWRDLPVTGGALFSSLRPRVRTQNLSTFLNSELSGPNTTRPVFNQLRLSYGRTRLAFDENRDTEFLIPSDQFPAEPFLLNARRRVNLTLPTSAAALFVTAGTVEGDLGPVGQVNIAGFSPVGVDVFNFPQRRVNNTYQVADTMTYRVGGHSFAFGTDLRRTELNSDLPRNSRPLITFNGAPTLSGAFISGLDLAAASAASGFFQTLATTTSDIGLRYYQINFFGQDEWRIRPNLSISYGLRYEYNTPPREVNERIENAFANSATNILPGLSALQNRDQIYEPDRNNFAPRIGFAWSPNFFENRETVIRAGYGLYYDQILGAVVSQSRNVFPNFLTVNFAGGFGGSGGLFDLFNPSNAAINIGTPAAPNFVPLTIGLNTFNPQIPLPTLVNVINSNFPGGFGATLPARELQTPMAHQFSATFEQQLTRNLVASVAYVGTRGRNLLRTTTPNLGPNTFLLPLEFSVAGNVPSFFGFAFAPGSATPAGGRPVPSAGAVNIYETSASSNYNALQVQLRGRLSFITSTQFQVNYTFSKVSDDASDVFDLAGSSALPQNSLTFEGERAPSNFDVRHRVSYSSISTLPDLNNRHPLLRFFFGGLQWASTGMLHTGQPFTVNSIYDINLDGNLTDRLNTLNGIVFTDNRSQPLTTTSRDPFFLRTLLAPTGDDGAIGRNTFRSGLVMMGSLAIIKNFNITEGQNLTFRMEVFNVMNRSNFGIPIRTLESPGFGKAIETVTPSRRIQFALKYSF